MEYSPSLISPVYPPSSQQQFAHPSPAQAHRPPSPMAHLPYPEDTDHGSPSDRSTPSICALTHIIFQQTTRRRRYRTAAVQPQRRVLLTLAGSTTELITVVHRHWSRKIRVVAPQSSLYLDTTMPMLPLDPQACISLDPHPHRPPLHLRGAHS